MEAGKGIAQSGKQERKGKVEENNKAQGMDSLRFLALPGVPEIDLIRKCS